MTKQIKEAPTYYGYGVLLTKLKKEIKLKTNIRFKHRKAQMEETQSLEEIALNSLEADQEGLENHIDGENATDGELSTNTGDINDEVKEEEPEKEYSAGDFGSDEEEQEQPQQQITEAPVPVELPEAVWAKMNPEQQYIYSELPEIRAVGVKEDGTIYALDVKTPDQLPDNFKFANDKAQASFVSSISSQELKANELQKNWRMNQQEQQYQEFNRRDGEEIKADIEKLQREGVLPKFKRDITDEKFGEDETAQLCEKILQFRTEANQNYHKNGTTRRLGFEEATYIYLAKQARENKEEPKQDQERKDIAKKIGTRDQGAKAEDNKNRSKFRPNTSIDDIVDYYNTMEGDW